MKNQPFSITVSVKTPEGQTITIDEVLINGSLSNSIYLRTPNRATIKIDNADEHSSMFQSRTETSNNIRFHGF